MKEDHEEASQQEENSSLPRLEIMSALLKLIKDIESEDFTDEVKGNLASQIQLANESCTINPREETEGNGLLFNAMLVAVLSTVEELYGDLSGKFHHLPMFWPDVLSNSHSQLMPLKNDNETFVVVLGDYVATWENAFYDMCHECIHLLNPVLNVADPNEKVSALDEGVAVKFAEEMYGRYIKPYCKQSVLTSPVDQNATWNQYFIAYSAAKKIPDKVLKEVRAKFERFSKIDDFETFKDLVGTYLTDKEAEELAAQFNYPQKS